MPASWRTSDLTVLAVAGAGTVLLTAASFMVAPPDALPRNDGSSYAAHPDGARAAFLLLKELGYHVDRSFEPVTAIRHAPEHTALVLANPSEAPSAAGRAGASDVRRARRARPCDGSRRRGVSARRAPEDAEESRRGGLRASRARRQDRGAAEPRSPTACESIDMPSATAPLPLESPLRRRSTGPTRLRRW